MTTRDNAGFGWPGGFGAGFGPGMGETLGAATRRYFETMADALRGVSAGASPAPEPWRAVFDAWSGAAGGRGAFGEDLDAVVGRFAAQGRQWFGRMQSLVERFAGRDAAPADVLQAWKAMLGGEAANPFADVFAQMGGRGHAGFEQWFAQVAPLLRAGWAEGAMREGSEWLSLPAFGPAREHQERWQALARAMLGLQQANDGYNALMLEAGRDAFVRFERKLAERSEPGRQLQSARALFDLWVDAAEEAYAEVALSVEFRQRYAQLVDAQMRVRGAVQNEVERMTGSLGMPTRTEVDAAHRRIAQLERELRRLQRGAGVPSPARAAKQDAEAAMKPAPKVESKPASKAAPKAASRPRSKPGSTPTAKASAGKSGPAAKPPAKAASTKASAGQSASTMDKPARRAAARATQAPSKRAAMLSAAMPQAPEPMPSAGRTARPTRSAGRKR